MARTYDKSKGKPLKWLEGLTEGEADDKAAELATPTEDEITVIRGKIVPELAPFLDAIQGKYGQPRN